MGAAAAVVTAGGALAAAVERLAAAGVPEPRADAEVLLAHALGTTRTGLVLVARTPLPAAATDAFAALVARRVAREPVHYLVGEREFWSLPFAVDRRVLVPRPETETLVGTALDVGRGARRVLDVCTGSGVVAAVLARELPGAFVWASDVDAHALAVARANLARHAPGVPLVRADLLAGFADRAFDLVVANPPYVAEPRFPELAPEVRDHEPRAALAAGRDGLAVLRALVLAAPRVLADGGWLVVEMGAGQAAAVRELAEGAQCYAALEVVRDHAGIERVLAARAGRGTWRRS
jgi:release factor glutamine methyltransferase